MVRAWFLDDSPEQDKQLPNQTNPPIYVDPEQLHTLTGIKYWQINVEDIHDNPLLNDIRQKEGYTFEDHVELSSEQFGKMGPFQSSKFYVEHLHEADESRLVLEGSGYFDVRAFQQDRWVRVEVVRGDMLVLPGGIYHRFTVDKKEYSKIHRFFKDDSGRAALNRPVEDNPARQKYVKIMQAKCEK